MHIIAINVAVLNDCINKTMSEYNPVVIIWEGRAKPAGLSFLIVNLGAPWTLPINQCPREIVLI